MPFACDKCSRNASKRHLKYVLGNGTPGQIALIGVQPTEADARSGYPFISQGAAGDRFLLERLCKDSGLSIDQFFMTYVLKCPPPADPPKEIPKEEIKACSSYLQQELKAIKPKVLIVMGKEAVKSVLGRDQTIKFLTMPLDSKDCPVMPWAAEGMGAKNAEGLFKAYTCPTFGSIRKFPDNYQKALQCFKAVKECLEGRAIQSTDVTKGHRYAFTEPDVFTMLSRVYGRLDREKRLFLDTETSGIFWYQRKYFRHRSHILCAAFGFGVGDVDSFLLKEPQRSARVLDLVEKILRHPIPKTAHNGKFDQHFFQADFGTFARHFDFDTMLAAHLLDQDSKGDEKKKGASRESIGLSSLSPKLRPELGHYWEHLEDNYLDRKEYGYLNAPEDLLLKYCALDVDVTVSVYEWSKVELEKNGLIPLFQQLVMPHLLVAFGAETYGVLVDELQVRTLGHQLLIQSEELLASIYKTIGKHPEGLTPMDCMLHGIENYRPLNLNSAQQLAKYLFDELKLPVESRSDKTNQPTVDAETLKSLSGQAPFLKDFLEYRSILKKLSGVIGWERDKRGKEGPIQDPTKKAFLVRIDDQNAVHTDYNLAATATGRIGSSAPNLQNVGKSKDLRSLIVARPGWSFLDCDFSGLELRILAVLSGDEKMLKAFRDGVDLHSLTAANLFGMNLEDFVGVDYTGPDGQVLHYKDMEELKAVHPEASSDQTFIRSNRKERKRAKVTNFAVLYGEGAGSLSADLGVTYDEAQSYIDGWFQTYSGAATFVKKLHAETTKTGRVRYSWGRYRNLPGIFSSDSGIRSAALRQCVNTPIQGCLKYTTRVTTNTGLHPIGDLHRGKVKADLVWDGKGWRPFTVVNRGPAELVEVTTRDGTTFDCDVRHEFLCHTMRNGGVKFRNVLEMSNQTRICASLRASREFGSSTFKDWIWNGHSHKSKKLIVSEAHLQEMWFVVGYHVGAGFYTHDDVSFTFGEKDLKRNLPRLNNFFESIGAGPLRVKKNPGSIGDAWVGVVHGKGVTELFKALGYTRGVAKTKRIPNALWKETLANRTAFCQGYYASDGTKGRPFGTAHCSNHKLMKEYRQILNSIGVFSRIGLYADGTAQVSAHGEKTVRQHGVHNGRRFYGLSPDYDFRIVRTVRRLGIVEDTYTLSVWHEDHRFDSEGLISKNTGADCLSHSLVQIQRRIVEEGYSAVAHMVLEIHDSGVWEVRDEYVPTIKRIVIEEMCRPKPFLPAVAGFSLEVSPAVGKNLSDMV